MKTWDFKDVYLYETVKVAVSARVMSSDVRWRQILHEYFHVISFSLLVYLTKSTDPF